MKNMRRVLLKKKGRDRKKSNAASPEGNTPTGSPIPSVNRRVSDMPVSMAMHTSSPSRKGSAPVHLVSNTTEAWASNKPTTPLTTVSATTPVAIKVSIGGLIEDNQTLRDREGVISITKDVQKFLATISELRQAMEELDIHSQTPRIKLLEDCDEDTPDNNQGLLMDTNSEGEEGEEREDEGEETEGEEEVEKYDDNVIKKLKDLVEVVEVCLNSNPGMQSTVLTDASKDLLKTYKNCCHENTKVCECTICSRAIDNLVDTFTQCVSDYMIGENIQVSLDVATTTSSTGGGGGNGSVGVGGVNRGKPLGLAQKGSLGFSKSYDNLAMFSSNLDLSQIHDPVVDQIDQELSSVENPITVASNYIKLRQKYHRELVGYLNKRAQLEQKYYSQLGRLVKQSQSAVADLEQHQVLKDCLPLVGVFRQSLENDSRYAMNCNTTFNLQVTHKILEPLERQIQECEKSRKILVNNWLRESKKVVESRTAMKSSKARYEFFGQELIRIKNLLANEPVGPRAEKRKREITELETKWQESEGVYKEAVAHCNDCQYQVHEMAQKSILCAFRRIVIGFDTALKSGLESYFMLQYNFFRSLPDPLLDDIRETQEYEVGSEFLHFIMQQARAPDELEDYHFEEFDPESDLWDVSDDSSSTKGSEMSRSTLALSSINSDTRLASDRAVSPTAIDHPGIKGHLLRTETPSPKPDSKRGRPKSMLLDTLSSMSSPSFNLESPKNTLQRRNSEKGKDGALSVSPPLSTVGISEELVYSKMAKTHSLKKLRTPARCRGCDTYVYFHGFDCETCGLACHRKCLATLAIRCGTKKLPRKMNVFGIDFHHHLKATKQSVPIIVTKCIKEIDSRGLDTQGLYRISSAKSKMEKLCQLFESGSERVDLSDLPPHLISSCLKLYFRQLPEPLLTFEMYQEFLTFAREASCLLPCNFTTCDQSRAQKARDMLQRLQGLVERLHENSQLTLARLMYHLNRVSSQDHVRVNCMPASNLGIVFGPNLLRQKEVVPSLALLANMSLQAKAVEIMVAHAHDIFHFPEEQIIQLELDASEENYTLPNERPIDVESSAEMIEMKSDINDQRTPISTPPEKRKQNVDDLHEIIEGFTSGNLLSPVSARSKSMLIPPLVSASPLLTDSRHWQDSNDRNSLPGSIPENFSESVFNSLDRRLRPHSTIEKVLTPVMEIKDDPQGGEDSSEDGTEIRILSASDNNTLDRLYEPRRTQSFTKSSSTGFGEESDSIVDSEVFHSRTASNASSTGEPGLSRSEDNLLQHSGKYASSGEKPENDFLKFVTECSLEERSSDSNDSLKYNPFDSPDVQALLKPSNKHCSPHTYPRPNKALIQLQPTRQMSEGEIKHTKPLFSVGSPPFDDSPVSFRSIGKSTSIASSQGSFSEGIVEDISDSYSSKRVSQQTISNEESKLKRNSLGKEEMKGAQEESLTSNDRFSVNGDDLLLPDNSPIIVNPKLLRHHHFHSMSRDSGLSDSPDPSVDLSSSPMHTVNSSILTDRLNQVTKAQQSPLVNRNQVSSKPDTLSDNAKKFQELLASATSSTKPRPQKLAKHVLRVMRITPSLDNEDLLSPVTVEERDDIQRLRMASPEELTDKQIGFSMKRSYSQGEVLKSGGDSVAMDTDEEGTRRFGELIISEARIGHKASHSEHSDFQISRSLENIIDNF